MLIPKRPTSRKKRRPARRYVYLMERTSGRTWKTIITFRREIKIGVARDVNQRLQQVIDGIPGTIVLVYEKKVDRATTIEAQLHRQFSQYNFRVTGAKKGSGETEFFRLRDSHIRQAKRALNQREANIQDWAFVVFTVIVIIIYILLKPLL